MTRPILTREFPATPSYRAVTLTFANGVLSYVIEGHATVAATGMSEAEAWDVTTAIDNHPTMGPLNALDSALSAMVARRAIPAAA